MFAWIAVIMMMGLLMGRVVVTLQGEVASLQHENAMLFEKVEKLFELVKDREVSLEACRSSYHEDKCDAN